MSNLVFTVLGAIAQRARVNFTQKTKRVEAVQTQFLRSLLRAHQHTEWGKQYGLSEIKTIDEFRDRVPVLPYSSYEPYIERMVKGETNLLTPDPVIFFNLTSGSTGVRKFIPVTRRSRQKVARANQVAMGFAVDAMKRQGLPLGKMLFTSPSRSTGVTPSGIPYGPISTSDLRLMGSLYRHVFAYPFEALQIADAKARHYVCLLFAMQEASLRMMGFTFPVLGLQLADYLARYGEDLVHDMERGAIADWLELEPGLRARLERQLKAMPERAKELQTRLRANGQLTPKDVFPNLSVIVTARGGTSDFYFERFPPYFGDTPIFGGTYCSAETVFGVHRDLNTNGVILALESAFYEFMPEDQWDAAHPKTVLPWEVIPGQRYRILTTNYSGFYRYDIGDVVEVEGFYNQAPIFVFRYRRGGVISSTTEKTTEFHVIQVMQALQREFGVSLTNFCITLSDDRIPAHYWVNVELAPGSTLPNPAHFLQRFDEQLKHIHQSYALKRQDQVPPPQLRILAPGSFTTVQQRMVQRGATDFQLKFPHVTEDRTLLSDLPILAEVRSPADLDRRPVLKP